MFGLDLKTGRRYEPAINKGEVIRTDPNISSPPGYGASRSAKIRENDDIDNKTLNAKSLSRQASALAPVDNFWNTPDATGTTSSPPKQDSNPLNSLTSNPAGRSSTITSKPGSTGSFSDTNSVAQQASQVQDAQSSDFWRNQGVLEQTSKDAKAYSVNRQVDSENFQLQKDWINQGNQLSLMRQKTSDDLVKQGRAEAAQAGLMTQQSAMNAQSQDAETQRARIAAQAQMNSTLYASALGGGSFRYW